MEDLRNKLVKKTRLNNKNRPNSSKSLKRKKIYDPYQSLIL